MHTLLHTITCFILSVFILIATVVKTGIKDISVVEYRYLIKDAFNNNMATVDKQGNRITMRKPKKVYDYDSHTSSNVPQNIQDFFIVNPCEISFPYFLVPFGKIIDANKEKSWCAGIPTDKLNRINCSKKAETNDLLNFGDFNSPYNIVKSLTINDCFIYSTMQEKELRSGCLILQRSKSRNAFLYYIGVFIDPKYFEKGEC
ncbi:hypothetical protein CDIK_1996 [Cucumispora dikerogammari]|nr:hypothetical protein CDIK_1996 [Cucumispora dikerogammari]